MTTRKRINAPVFLAVLAAFTFMIAIGWLYVSFVVGELTKRKRQLTMGDSCSVDPHPPCLNAFETVSAQPDNTAMWGIFLVGLAAGFVLAFVLTAPSAYQLGKREGWHGAHRLMSKRELARVRRSTYQAQHARRR